jgi:hypothetical protein
MFKVCLRVYRYFCRVSIKRGKLGDRQLHIWACRRWYSSYRVFLYHAKQGFFFVSSNVIAKGFPKIPTVILIDRDLKRDTNGMKEFHMPLYIVITNKT